MLLLSERRAHFPGPVLTSLTFQVGTDTFINKMSGTHAHLLARILVFVFAAFTIHTTLRGRPASAFWAISENYDDHLIALSTP